jgi:hypothetical protein
VHPGGPEAGLGEAETLTSLPQDVGRWFPHVDVADLGMGVAPGPPAGLVGSSMFGMSRTTSTPGVLAGTTIIE